MSSTIAVYVEMTKFLWHRVWAGHKGHCRLVHAVCVNLKSWQVDEFTLEFFHVIVFVFR